MTRGRRRTETLARLLSGRDAPSVLEKEALFERIEHELGRPESQRRPGRLSGAWWGLWSGAVVASALALSLVLVSPPPERREALTAKGSAPPRVRVRCAEGICRRSSTLLVEVSPDLEARHLGAFLRRPDGVVAWILPSRNGHTRPVDSGLLDVAVTLPADGPAGTYELWAVLTEGSRSRSELRAMLDDDPTRAEVEVRAFEVAP